MVTAPRKRPNPTDSANPDAPFAREFRRVLSKKYTHQALADKLGINTMTEISHLVNGVRDPSERILRAIQTTFPKLWPKLFVAAIAQKLEGGETPVIALPVDLTRLPKTHLALMLTMTWGALPDGVATRTAAFLLKEMRAAGWELPTDG